MTENGSRRNSGRSNRYRRTEKRSASSIMNENGDSFLNQLPPFFRRDFDESLSANSQATL